MSLCLFTAVLSLLLSPYISLAKLVEETDVYIPNTQWAYLDKFCFEKQGGSIDIAFTPSEEHPDAVVLFYHDMDREGFDHIAQSGHSCEYKVNHATGL